MLIFQRILDDEAFRSAIQNNHVVVRYKSGVLVVALASIRIVDFDLSGYRSGGQNRAVAVVQQKYTLSHSIRIRTNSLDRLLSPYSTFLVADSEW